MTKPYRTENAELTDAAKAIGLRVLGVYHHPDDEKDTAFARCPSCGIQAHYTMELLSRGTKCGCDILSHIELRSDVEKIDKRSKEYKAWIHLLYRVRSDRDRTLHPMIESFRQFVAVVGECPVIDYVLSIESVPEGFTEEDYPLVVGVTDDCDLKVSWREINRITSEVGSIGGHFKGPRVFTDDKGVTKTASAWSKIKGIPAMTIRKRVSVYGWSEHDAIHRALRWTAAPRKIIDETTGEAHFLVEWARILDIPCRTFRDRLEYGLSETEVIAGCRDGSWSKG